MLIEESDFLQLKEKYNVHPLIISRSIAYAESFEDLTKILETLPKLPIVWNYKNHCWKKIGL